MKIHSSQLNLKYTQILIWTVFVFLPLHIFAASDTKSVKSLDMIQGDNYLPSETRFNYQFTCFGDDRIIELQGRNYKSNDGLGRAEISRIQTNAKVVKDSDIDSINKRIYDPSGSKFFSTRVECNKHEVIVFVNYRKFVEKKSENSTLEIQVSSDGSINFDQY